MSFIEFYLMSVRHVKKEMDRLYNLGIIMAKTTKNKEHEIKLKEVADKIAKISKDLDF